MGFNDLILISPVSSSAFDHMEEIEDAARDRVATRLQGRLRNIVDPGVDLQAAQRAQELKVSNDGDRFVIKRQDQAGVVRPNVEPPSEDDPNAVENIEQLFEMSSGVPTAGADGSLNYRTISPSMLFGEMQRSSRAQEVEQAIANTLRDDLVDAYDESIEDVYRRTARTE